MKSLVKKLANTELGILLRNSFNYRPIYVKHYEKNYPITVSDAFLWRTDNGYKTKFKYSDILSLFFKIKDSWIELHFYSKKNELLKVEKINNINLSNQLEINSDFFDNLEDYGVFYVYHFSKNKDSFVEDQNVISNRCYLGYSLNNKLYSFVHGNVLAKFTSINSKSSIYTDMVKISLFKNQKYTIQKYFNDFDKNELIFTNPTSKIIKFTLENKDYTLKPNCTLLLETKATIITIVSNCLFFRPTVFSYKDEYVDVHHS